MPLDFEIPLEIFGQDPKVAFATPFIFFWPLKDDETTSKYTTALQNGLVILTKELPWVAGNVINRASTATDAYPYKIVPSGSTPELIVHDYRQALHVPSMDELAQKNFPIRLLDENVLSPVNVLPGKVGEKRDAVLTIQCNRLRGGLAVTIVGNHQVLDGTGQEQLVYLLDKACRGEAFTSEEIATAKLERTTIIQLFDSDWQTPHDTMYIKPPSSNPSMEGQPKSDIPTVKWVNWAFSKASLTGLKTLAMEQISCDFVSTDDVLTAFIWQALARARIARLGPDVKSTIGRAVNPRRYVGIPATYPGYISNNAFSKLTLQELVSSSLGQVATILRTAVEPRTSALHNTTREFATLLYRAADRSEINMGACLDVDSDLILSSWANMRCYQFTFGLGLGPPSAFRRPQQALVPGLVFLLPKRQDGEIVVKMGIRSDDLDIILNDKDWTKSAEYIG
jgi:hypothetical protein